METTNDVARIAELVYRVKQSTVTFCERNPFFGTWYAVRIEDQFTLTARAVGDVIVANTASHNTHVFRSHMLADAIRAKFQ